MAKESSTPKYVLAAAVLSVAVPLFAAPTNPEFTWNGGVSGGTWNTTAGNTDWLNGATSVAWPTSGTTNAIFATNNAAVTVGAAISTVGALEFTVTGVRLSANSAQTVTLNRDATLNNNAYPASISVGSGNSATIGDYVTLGSSGGTGMFVIGGGTLIFSSSAPGTKPGGAANFAFGPFAIQQGSTVNVQAGGSITTGASQAVVLGDISNATPAGSNNTLTVSGGTVTSGGSIAIGRSGSANCLLNITSGSVTGTSLTLYNSGLATDNTTVTLAGGTLNVNSVAKASAGSGSTIFNFDGGTLKPTATNASFWSSSNILTSANVKAGGAKIDTASFNITIAQPLVHYSGLGATADGGLTKSSAGTLTLSGVNTFTGVTTITGGTLALSGSGSIANSAKIIVGDSIANNSATLDVSGVTSGGITLGSSQTLAGHGIIKGNITTSSGTHLAPGNSLGMTTYQNNLTLVTGTVLDYDFGASGTSDLTAVTGTLALPATTGAITLNLSDAGGLGDGTYKLFSYGSLSGGNGTFTDTFTVGTSPLTNKTYTFVDVPASKEVDMIVVTVPEPTMLGMAGLVGLGLLSKRRRCV